MQVTSADNLVSMAFSFSAFSGVNLPMHWKGGNYHRSVEAHDQNHGIICITLYGIQRMRSIASTLFFIQIQLRLRGVRFELDRNDN